MIVPALVFYLKQFEEGAAYAICFLLHGYKTILLKIIL